MVEGDRAFPGTGYTNTLARDVPYKNAAHRGRVCGGSVLSGSAARSIKRVGEESFEELETPYISSYAAIGPTPYFKFHAAALRRAKNILRFAVGLEAAREPQ